MKSLVFHIQLFVIFVEENVTLLIVVPWENLLMFFTTLNYFGFQKEKKNLLGPKKI